MELGELLKSHNFSIGVDVIDVDVEKKTMEISFVAQDNYCALDENLDAVLNALDVQKHLSHL
jgi:hypothetical protein